MILLASFHILLHLYSSQKTIMIGYPSANRSNSNLNQIFGYFVNTLVSKTTYEKGSLFADIIKQVKNGILKGIKNESFPFQDLLKSINPPRIEGVSPLFQAMFVMQNAPHSIEGFPDLNIQILPQRDLPVIYDIVLEAIESESEIRLSFEYRIDALPSFIIKQFSQHFQFLLNHILDDSNRELHQLSLVSEKQHAKKIFDYPASVIDLFEKQAISLPEKIAIESPLGSLTYQALNAKANGIAQLLLNLGLKPQEPVGFCLERSPDQIATILGIAKAGGAYVPIDSNYPIKRIHFMLEDAGIRFLLIKESTRSNFLSVGSQLIHLDNIESQSQIERPLLDKNDLAYILYTSGSTGKPKGVMVEHGSLANFTLEAIKLFEIKEIDRVLQFSSISWDTSSEEIYPCLASGGTLVLRGDEPLETFDALLKRIDQFQISILDLPTSYWQDLCDELLRQKIPLPVFLRLVIVGGEKIARKNVNNWIQAFGTSVRLLNTYGATEATSISLAFDLSNWSENYPDAPIGNTLGNVKAHILNEYLEKVPVGVTGKLYLSGTGLARGYVNLPQLTEQKFIINPKTNERLYHTGDIAYESPDGIILLQGRADAMIKRRGFRIELSEIERALNKMEYVSKCLVVEKKNESKSPELIVYLVLLDKALLFRSA